MTWFESARPGNCCSYYARCYACEPNGNCDMCGTIDGRWIEAVAEYASTCDWCGELEMNEKQRVDPETHLGYCEDCIPKLPEDVRGRLEL